MIKVGRGYIYIYSLTLTEKIHSKQIIKNNHIMDDSHLQLLTEKFNLVSKAKGVITKKCAELKPLKHYAIHSLIKKETQNGDAIIAVLGDSPYKNGNEPKLQIFLPKRFVDLLIHEDLDSIPTGQYYLVSHGPSGVNSTELTLHLATN